jgi:type I restriction enzyme S subunit
VKRIYGGGTPSRFNRNYWGNEIPWATVKDIATFDGVSTQEMITRQGLEASASQLVPAGTLIVCTRMAPGSALIFQTEVAINQDMKALICGRETSSEFLRLVLNFKKKELVGISSGSTVAGLGIADLTSLRILLPPLKEQEAIAEALSNADAAIDSLDALIKKKRDLKQATMQQLLTGRTRLPGFTADWKEVSIGSFTDCKAGGTPSTSVPAYWGGDIRWMSSGELNLKRVREVSGRITQAGLENSSAQFFPADSVLIGLAGQGKTRGTAAFNLVGLTTNQSIAAILPSARHDSKFLFYVMETKYKELRDLSDGGGGRGGLNLTIIKDVRVTVPELDEQEKVSEILWSMDDELDALTEQVSKLRMVKEGMMQDLLTGKVRLV